VQDKLEEEWSPAQIAAHLREAYPGRPEWHLSHETTYRAFYHGGKGGLRRTLTKNLRTGRRLRTRRRSATDRAPRSLAPARPIDARPAVVVRTQPDLGLGGLPDRRSGQPLGDRHLAVRRTGYLRLVHLPDGHAAERQRVAMLPVLGELPAMARQTLTWDQGSEMARHDLLAEHFADGISFAHPASPWLRGTNENTNTLLRQYFPWAATSGGTRPPT
jgi:IS30 family transposase